MVSGSEGNTVESVEFKKKDVVFVVARGEDKDILDVIFGKDTVIAFTCTGNKSDSPHSIIGLLNRSCTRGLQK